MGKAKGSLVLWGGVTTIGVFRCVIVWLKLQKPSTTLNFCVLHFSWEEKHKVQLRGGSCTYITRLTGPHLGLCLPPCVPRS